MKTTTKLNGVKKKDTLSSSHNGTTQILKYNNSKEIENKKQSLRPMQEKQGPIDWSINGLKSKYRGEIERENAWETWKLANSYSTSTFDDENFVIPVTTVVRHPFLVSFYKNLDNENYISFSRTKSRLLMKRFVFDVQEVWLANLQHLREHDLSQTYFTNDNNDVEEDVNIIGARGKGLQNRRDSKAIASMESQIQSVSMKKVFERSYNTVRLPDVQVALDYIPPPSAAILKGVKPLPPIIESLVEDVHFKPLSSIHSKSETDHMQVFTFQSSIANQHSTNFAIVNIERLLPSSDYQLLVNAEVLWRIGIFYGSISRVASEYFVSKESDIMTYLQRVKHSSTSLIEPNLMDNDQPSHSMIASHSSAVYSPAQSFQIPLSFKLSQLLSQHSIYSRVVNTDYSSSSVFQYLEEVEAGISITLNGYDSQPSSPLDSNSQPSSVCIDIYCVISLPVMQPNNARDEQDQSEEDDDEQDDSEIRRTLHLRLIPPEIQFILKTLPNRLPSIMTQDEAFQNFQPVKAYDIPLNDVTWWTEQQRSLDLWPYILSNIFIDVEPNIEVSDKEEDQEIPHMQLQILKPSIKRLKSAEMNSKTKNQAKMAKKLSKKALEMERVRNQRVVAESDISFIDTTDPDVLNANASITASNAADRLVGALSSLQARALAYDLLNHINIEVNTSNPLDMDQLGDIISNKIDAWLNTNNNEHNSVPLTHEGSLNTETSPAPELIQLNLNWKYVHGLESPSFFSKDNFTSDSISTKRIASGRDLNNSSSNDSGNENPEGGNLNRGQVYTPPISLAVELTNNRLYSGCWEELVSKGLNSSLIASGAVDRTTLIPGSTEYGKVGLSWSTDDLTYPVEYTQGAALFFRDYRLTASESIMVLYTLALDIAKLFPTLSAWENWSENPIPCPAEEVDGSYICMYSAVPVTLTQVESLKSPIQTRLSQTILIFNAIATPGVDYMSPSECIPKKDFGYKRNVPVRNSRGYREQTEVRLLGVDPVLPTIVFGVTKLGAQPNVLGVNPRNIWHNTLPVTEHINRPRGSKDFHYILARELTYGSTDPTSYTTRMKGGELVGVTSSAFKNYEDSYAKILELRGIFHKQIALENKLEKIQLDYDMRQKQMQEEIRRLLQKKLEKKLRKATRSEIGWNKRYQLSSLVEIQNNWERRRDDRTGVFFFHRIPDYSRLQSSKKSQDDPHLHTVSDYHPDGRENYAVTCQWEVPPAWDGDPMLLYINESNQEEANPLSKSLSGILGGKVAQTGWERKRNNAVASTPSGKNRKTRREQQFGGQVTGITDNIHNRVVGSQKRSVGPMGGEDDNDFDSLISDNDEGYSDMDHDEEVDVVHNDHNDLQAGHHRVDRTNPLDKSVAFQNTQPVHGTTGHRTTGKRRVDRGADDVDMDSGLADRSLVGSEAPTIDTVNLEHIAEQLVSSDELMRVLARRLGLPTDQIVPADELSSVFTIDSIRENKRLNAGVGGPTGLTTTVTTMKLSSPSDREHLNAPRDQWFDAVEDPEFDSDDDLWSDEGENEAGDFDVDKHLAAKEDLPEDFKELSEMKRREWREAHPDKANKIMNGLKADQQSKGKADRRDVADDFTVSTSKIPYLQLPQAIENTMKPPMGGQEEDTFGWRRLPRPNLKAGFLDSALRTHTLGPNLEEKSNECITNTLNQPIFLLPISPIDACKYIPPEFSTTIESIFIPDCKRDIERAIATLDRNIRREEELSRNIPTDELLLFGEASEFTSADAYIARQNREDQAAVEDPRDVAIEKAILAAKSDNIAIMEDALAEDIPINSADSFGNSLLILASQQGSKRMCKFLLRRGANINFQNLSGNTALHYCYAYSHKHLAEYLVSKGANDAILNMDGLTCYEGMSKDDINDDEDGDDG